MVEPSTERWRHVGDTSNTSYYEIEAEVLGVVPHAGSVDDAQSARENQAWQNRYWHERGHGGVVIIFFDRLASQDNEARRVYSHEPDTRVMRAAALVGGTLLGRAIGSFFLGISRPRIPLRMFGSFEQALAWAHEVNAAARGRAEGGAA